MRERARKECEVAWSENFSLQHGRKVKRGPWGMVKVKDRDGNGGRPHQERCKTRLDTE